MILPYCLQNTGNVHVLILSHWKHKKYSSISRDNIKTLSYKLKKRASPKDANTWLQLKYVCFWHFSTVQIAFDLLHDRNSWLHYKSANQNSDPTYCMYNSGLGPISQSNYRLRGGVNLYKGHCAVRVVNGLHHGPRESLRLGDGVCRGSWTVLVKHVKQVLSAMVFVTVLNNSSQSFCPRNLESEKHLS